MAQFIKTAFEPKLLAPAAYVWDLNLPQKKVLFLHTFATVLLGVTSLVLC